MDLEIQEKEQTEDSQSQTQETVRFSVNQHVTVTDDYKSHGDAGDGPLTVGDVGLVLEDDNSDVPYQVVSANGTEWWYAAEAIVKMDDENAIEEFKKTYQEYLDNRDTSQENETPLWNPEQDNLFQQQQQAMQEAEMRRVMAEKEREYVNALTLYHADNKFRCGDNSDSGYVISDVKDGYDMLLSGGAGGNISFEKQLCDKYDLNCLLFDGVHEEGRTAELDVSESESHKKITLIEKNVGETEDEKTTNLKPYLQTYNNLFVKLDVEGGEWGLFASLDTNEMNKIKQMAVEFHMPQTMNHWEVFKKITETHVLIHYHANNNCPMILSMDRRHVPGVFECTFLRKDIYAENFGELKLNTETLPTSLDVTNMPSKFDFFFNCTPWVHPKSEAETKA